MSGFWELGVSINLQSKFVDDIDVFLNIREYFLDKLSAVTFIKNKDYIVLKKTDLILDKMLYCTLIPHIYAQFLDDRVSSSKFLTFIGEQGTGKTTASKNIHNAHRSTSFCKLFAGKFLYFLINSCSKIFTNLAFKKL